MGLVSIEEVVYAESNGHVTDDITRPYDVIVCLSVDAKYLRN